MDQPKNGAPFTVHRIPNRIGPFLRHTKKPTSMEEGFYYEAPLPLPFAPDRRMVRVWLPPTYDFVHPKKYPVIYMADGQNLVDFYLTAYGDWRLDKVVRELRANGYPEPILVGLDCPKGEIARANELFPPFRIKKSVVRKEIIKKKKGRYDPRGQDYVAFFVDVLKPLVDKTFSTDPRREATAIGGSSMGGINAFYGFLSRPDVYGYSLSFSVPFFFYSKREIHRVFRHYRPSPETSPLLTLFVGGVEFERQFVKGNFYVKRVLEKRYGFAADSLQFLHDPKAKHHEDAWYAHSYEALAFWLGHLIEKD